jgi:hypothetical protein
MSADEQSNRELHLNNAAATRTDSSACIDSRARDADATSISAEPLVDEHLRQTVSQRPPLIRTVTIAYVLGEVGHEVNASVIVDSSRLEPLFAIGRDHVHV